MARARNWPGFTGAAAGAGVGVAAAAFLLGFAGAGLGALIGASSLAIAFAFTTISFFTLLTPIEFFTMPLARSESACEATRPESVTTPFSTVAFTLLNVGDVARSCCTSIRSCESFAAGADSSVVAVDVETAGFLGQKISAPKMSTPSTAPIAISGVLEAGFSSSSSASKVGAFAATAFLSKPGSAMLETIVGAGAAAAAAAPVRSLGVAIMGGGVFTPAVTGAEGRDSAAGTLLAFGVSNLIITVPGLGVALATGAGAGIDFGLGVGVSTGWNFSSAEAISSAV